MGGLLASDFTLDTARRDGDDLMTLDWVVTYDAGRVDQGCARLCGQVRILIDFDELESRLLDEAKED